MEPEKSSNDDQIFGESEGESGTNNGSKHPTNELGLFTVPVDNEDQSSQFGNINLNLSIDTKKTQVSKDIDCGANTEAEIDKIDNSNQKIKLNENNQNKSLNDNKNAIISTSPSQSNTDNDIQPIDQISDNQDQNKNTSESQNPENSTIDKVDYKNIDSKSTIKTADNIIGHQKDQSKIINNPPIGLPNPSSYCYLNSILQTLFSCQQFREEIIEIYQNNKSTNCDNENKEFVVSLGNLFFQMKKGNQNEAENAVKELHKHFDRTIYGDDIHKCYLQILRKINDEIKTVPESDPDSTINNKADKQFAVYRQKNYGFIFDLFCGQLSFKQKCKQCSKEFNEKFQLFKSMPLQIPLTNSKIKECIECFFEESRIDGSNCKNCKEDLFSFSEITHSPQFIFIYLVRGAYSLSENKNNTFIEYDNYINIPTVKGNVLYKLRSVIDHLGGNESGHYFVKTLSGSDWYLLNDVQVRKINYTKIATKHSIGLLIEKVTNFDENIPEPLIDYDTKCFYQNGFQSILQIFYQCYDIRQYFIDIYTNKVTNENKTQELIFIETLGQIFYYIRNMNEQEIINGVKILYEIFGNSLEKNDIHNCYLNILNKMNDAIKSPIENHSEPNYINEISADGKFLFYKNKNNGIIFDNLFGQILFVTKCENRECNKVFHEKYQLFSILPLQIQSMEQNTPISECIESYFEKSKLEGSNYQCCDKQDIISISHCTNSPRFVFIYLVPEKYDTKLIKFDNYINIPTVNGNVLYKLRSVIDRSNYDNAYGGYLVKMLINSNWWLKKHNRMKHIESTDVPTKHSIGLLIEKVTNFDENILEPLIDYDTKCFYQNGFQSILQIFYQCYDIRQYFIDIYTNKITNENKTQELNFIEILGKLFHYMRNMNEQEIENETETLYQTCENCFDKDDIHKCFMEILNKINDLIKPPQENPPEPDNIINNVSADEQFLIYRNKKNGIIFDNFFGQTLYVTKCSNKECNKVFHRKYQLFSLIPLPTQSRNQNTPISECIESYFEKSKLEGSNYQCCDKQDIICISHCTHSPHFLFIYLVRGKYDTKFIEFDNYINIPTVNGNVLYKLRFVIDRSNYDNASRKYVVKILINSTWGMKKDYRMKTVNPKSVSSNRFVGLLFEKVTNINHNIPESLLIDKYNSNYQKSLESIIKFLYLCWDNRKHLIDFYTNKNTNETITGNLIFKRKIGEMMVILDKNETDKIEKLLKEILNFLSTKIQNIDQLYCCIMDKLNYQTTNINPATNQQSSAMAEPDLFGEQISMNLKCRLSEKIFQEGITIFKSMTIHEPVRDDDNITSERNVTITECIENFLETSEKNECNDKQQIISINQLTNSPQFIFIYLVRKSNKFIGFNNYINVPTVNGNVLYKLRYVIDQIGGSDSDYFVVKTKDQINLTSVPSKNSIALLIEKVTNINHNVPESLLDYIHHYQEALRSIIQMLYLCVDIRKSLIEFYTSDNSNENITENLIFKKKIGEVMLSLEHENESSSLNKLLLQASNFLPNKKIGIHELYHCVMNKLNEKETRINADIGYKNSMDECGYKRSRIYCDNCEKYFDDNPRPEIFKSFYLVSENNKLNLSKRIEKFCKSHLKCNDDIEKCCINPNINFVEEILSAPKYLFICFDRVERNVEVNKEIILNTKSGIEQYFLQSYLNYSTIQCADGRIKEFFSFSKFEPKSIPTSNKFSQSIIAVMMVRKDEIISERNQLEYGIDMTTKESFDSIPDQHDNLYKTDENINSEPYLAEEKLESDFITQSIKQIIELNKENKIHVLLGLLFSCTRFRDFMINLYNNNEIEKVFKKFVLIEPGRFVNDVCILYGELIKQKRINSTIKSDNKWNINQCFDYIFESIKLITESREFSKTIESSKYFNSNFIIDNFFGTILLEIICKNCSKSQKYEDSFSNLCVKKPQNKSSINLENCLAEYSFEENYQPKKKCCRNTNFYLLRKIIHAPPILFICFDEQSRKINQNYVTCDSKLKIDTTNGPVTYALVSLVDRNAKNMYDVKFLGHSGWWQTYPKSMKINNFDLFSKSTVGVLLKKLE